MGERRNPAVVVIGAGMTGLLLAIKLRESGISDVTVLEKADSIGGTWRENTYPGIACDVPSHAYTYSFEPNPDWSMHFPPGAEILRYFERVFHKYGIDRCTRFGEAVTRCAWDEQWQKWLVDTAAGHRFVADLLFSATGLLHVPVFPDIPGLASFAGHAFHSARWDHEVPLDGRRIGVIGTGSSACQIVPELVARKGNEVMVFQRTAQWIVKMENRRFSDLEKQRFRRQPWRMKLIRKLSELVYAQGTASLTSSGWFDRMTHRLMSWNARRFLNGSVRDPVLRAKLTPDYAMGCKRVVISENFYDAIQQPNAQLVTEVIERIEPGGVRTRDGTLHALDVLVLATGFDPTAYVRQMAFIGRGGLTIDQAWQHKISAYRSMFIPGFPNFVLMLGPNSPIGNQSVIEISEHQTAYVLQLVKRWQDGLLPVIEARPEALARWRAMIKDRMRHTVWVSGCRSWYLDTEGDALTWPDTWKRWARAMKTPDARDFVC
jgi:cation diffusion facilitator CzcD-associated flavoprotein CzcO